MDHFEIIWKLTQPDYVLTQVGRASLHRGQHGSCYSPDTQGDLGRRGAQWNHRAGFLASRRLGDLTIGIECCPTCFLYFTSLRNSPR